MLDKLQPLADRWGWFATALGVQRRFGDLNGGYLASAVTLAGFLSLFPLLLVAIAVLGFFAAGSTDLASDITRNLGLTGDAAKAITTTIAQAERSRKAASVIGLAGLLWSGLGLVAALQYALNSTWQVTGRGLRDKLTGLGWLAGASLLFAGSFAIGAVLNFLPGFLAPAGIVVGLFLNLGLWLWTMKVLPNRDVGWKALLPGAILGAIGFEALKILGALYVPRAVSSASALYGSLGVVFATLAWLLFFGRLVVYAAVLNVVRWEEEHGTETVELDVPRVPGQVTTEATRAGDARPATEKGVDSVSEGATPPPSPVSASSDRAAAWRAAAKQRR